MTFKSDVEIKIYGKLYTKPSIATRELTLRTAKLKAK